MPMASVCHPGTWAGAGGRSFAPRGTPNSAIGQGNPMLQPGAWGTRHCLHATLAPTPCHRHVENGSLQLHTPEEHQRVV